MSIQVLGSFTVWRGVLGVAFCGADFQIRENDHERSSSLSQVRLALPVLDRRPLPCTAIDSVQFRRGALTSTCLQPQRSVAPCSCTSLCLKLHSVLHCRLHRRLAEVFMSLSQIVCDACEWAILLAVISHGEIISMSHGEGRT
ncbi:hypothetical protein CC86DRAFT_98962 [Ophiobolus disseminans]|uniref:Uncharacterized protein n=1 Tax=Ophiobolus disseminans TaxID=1469910 RepID=A0A6A6ZLA5_9PLEO|nr:hypothetical protein CC86DRAFT_98962 [Ophiobolus disseminans]